MIDANTAGPTVRVVLPVTPPNDALICELPWVTPLARPAAVMVATALLDDAQVTEPVTSSVEPSE